jgi:hypothetical protein
MDRSRVAFALVALACAAPLTTAQTSTAATPAAAPMVVPFQDDYAKALAEARVRKVPIFIEAWAPW